MSKYTTELRFVCEELSGVTSGNPEEAIAGSWQKIFTTNSDTWEPSYKSVICKKILKHFYFYEIGFETFGQWKMEMNTKFEEILPYYNKLWKSAEIDFNPLWDTDLTRTGNKSGITNDSGENTNDRVVKDKTGGSDTKNINTTSQTDTNGGSSSTSSNNSTRDDMYSDTPQGTLSGVKTMAYLTNARVITDGENSNTESSDHSSENGTDTTIDTTSYGRTIDTSEKTTSTSSSDKNTNESWTETVKGKNGGSSSSKMLTEYRATILNIDELFMREFNDCFMLLW